MSLNQELESRHTAMVRRLVKSPDDLLAQMNAHKVSLIHSVLGIAGEIGELLDAEGADNFVEEAGDFLFYVRDLRLRFGFATYPGFGITIPAGFNPVVAVGDVVDIVKKFAVYNKSLTVDMCERADTALLQLEAWVEHELDLQGFSRDKALEENIAKLETGPNARYATGYSDAAADARADKQPVGPSHPPVTG